MNILFSFVNSAPLLTQFGETLHGLTVVRAFRAEKITSREYDQALSSNVRAYFGQWIANQWITVVLESIGVLIIGGTAVATAYMTDTNDGKKGAFVDLTPGTAGMVLTFTFNLPGTLMWLVRNFTNMETELVAVERLSECIELVPEIGSDLLMDRNRNQNRNQNQRITAINQASQLPRLIDRRLSLGNKKNSHTSTMLTGKVTVSDVHMRYRDDAPSVLSGIHLNIPEGSKVAVVGRTGAGKSSLFLALQKLYPFIGSVQIDTICVQQHEIGNSTKSNNLLEIRGAYAYVPQDPILFTGTVRSNLLFGFDSKDIPTENELWSCLEHVSMDNKVRNEWPEGLETQIISQGGNLSAGERQLLCLARALLQRARILLVDEGMSSVDAETDIVAHDALLGMKGCTVLSICHNLGSLERFDFVVVMDHGKVAEYGKPMDLLQSKDGSGQILQELMKRG